MVLEAQNALETHHGIIGHHVRPVLRGRGGNINLHQLGVFAAILVGDDVELFSPVLPSPRDIKQSRFIRELDRKIEKLNRGADTKNERQETDRARDG